MKKQLTITQLINFLNQFAPPSLAEDWDNVGLQVGSLFNEVRGILIALDVTEAVLEEARKLKVNVLITHHPLFLKPITTLDDATPVKRLVKAAIKQDLNILSFHTNLDATQQGLNDQLAQKLQLQSVRPLLPSKDPKYPQSGLGRMGYVPLMTLSNFLNHVSECLSVKKFRYVGSAKKPVSCVAVMSGSGADVCVQAARMGADVLVTGDVKYHASLDALSENIALVDVGHFASEIGMTSLVMNQVRNFLKEQKVLIPVYKVSCQKDPFEFY